jgi:apolipoprotein D and lipocalin family protein
MRKISIVLILFLSGCVGIPEDVKPVDNFKIEKYLGKWYEIARLDHYFERGLTRVTADYSLQEDGGVRVLNRGYSEKEKTWKEAEGKAYFVQETEIGYLKVSFFGPFYGSYIVFELDHENYQYSLVCGPDKSYLWILARKPEIEKELKDNLIERYCQLFCVKFLSANFLKKGRFCGTFPMGLDRHLTSIFRQTKANRV